MKRTFASVLAFCLMFSFVACAPKKSTSESTSTTTSAAEKKSEKEEVGKKDDAKSSSSKKKDKDGKKPEKHPDKSAKNNKKSRGGMKFAFDVPSERYVAGPAKDPQFQNIKLSSTIDKTKPFHIAYPEKMQAKFGKGLDLPKFPEKIVNLSISSLDILQKLNVKPVAVTSSSQLLRDTSFYKDVPQLKAAMGTIDTEAIVKAKPDLVMISAYYKEKVDKTFADLKIPVYYTIEGHTVTYEENKASQLIYAEAFGGQSAKEEVAKLFAAVEKKAAAFASSHKKRQAMILFSMGPFYRANSDSILGSMIKMCNFDNVVDKFENNKIRLAEVSTEKIIASKPEVLFLIGPPLGYNPDIYKKNFETIVGKDQTIWDAVPAIKNKQYIALPDTYGTSRGLECLIDFSNFIDIITEFFKD